MFKVVVYWRWDKGRRSADCFWCVPWPAVSSAAFEEQKRVAHATHVLQHGPDKPFYTNDPDLLAKMGYPEAARMLEAIPHAELRSRFSQMEREVFDADCPITREQIEEIFA